MKARLGTITQVMIIMLRRVNNSSCRVI